MTSCIISIQTKKPNPEIVHVVNRFERTNQIAPNRSASLTRPVFSFSSFLPRLVSGAPRSFLHFYPFIFHLSLVFPLCHIEPTRSTLEPTLHPARQNAINSCTTPQLLYPYVATPWITAPLVHLTWNNCSVSTYRLASCAACCRPLYNVCIPAFLCLRSRSFHVIPYLLIPCQGC